MSKIKDSILTNLSEAESLLESHPLESIVCSTKACLEALEDYLNQLEVRPPATLGCQKVHRLAIATHIESLSEHHMSLREMYYYYDSSIHGRDIPDKPHKKEACELYISAKEVVNCLN